MKTTKSSFPRLNVCCFAAAAALLLVGCQSGSQNSTSSSAAPAATTATATPAATTAPSTSVSTPTPAPSAPATAATTTATTSQLPLPIRIAAGATDPITDSHGNKWLPDQGFADGDTIQRPDITVTNTDIPEIFHAEHYGMTSFSEPVPNGHYTVKLYFCETYEGITGPGERVFSFKIQNNPEVKDFDVWAKTGGPFIAYVVTQSVDVTDGKLTITFTPNVENPQVNGIEILPAS
jgi:hypothetical protein